METELKITETKFVLRLDKDFNDPPNAAGFHHVVIPSHMEHLFHRGDVVDVQDDQEAPAVVGFRGRIRCLIAVVEPIDPARSSSKVETGVDK